MGRSTTPTPFAKVRAREATVQKTLHGERTTVHDEGAAEDDDYADVGVCCTFYARKSTGHEPYPYVALNRVEEPRDPSPPPMNSPPPVEGHDPNRTYCPLCPGNYSHYRSCKRHCVLDHHRRYEHRYNRCVEFRSEEEFRQAWLKCKDAQESGQKRRDRRSGIGSPPARNVPPMMKQEIERPLFRNGSAEGRTGGPDTRSVILQDTDDRRKGPPKTCLSESAITISDDGNNMAGKRVSTTQEMPSPLSASAGDGRRGTLPPTNTGAGEPKEGNLRGTSLSPKGRFRERERIRENWGARFRAGGANSSLPRRGRPNPSFPRPVRGRSRPVLAMYAYSAEKASADRRNHPDYILNKCHLHGGQYDHIIGAGVAPRGVNITISKEPLYPRTKGSASAPSDVSKSSNQQVSKGADSRSELLTSAQVCESVADEKLDTELKRYAAKNFKRL